MKKYFILSLILLTFVIMLTACSNPQGGYGPSWDVTAKLPLINGTEENAVTVEEVLGDINLGEGYNENLLSDNSNLYDIGTELTGASFPSVGGGEDIELGPITITGLNSANDVNVPISPGVSDGSISINSSIAIPVSFTELKFASTPTISVTNNSSDITISSLSIDLEYNDGSSTLPETVNFSSINPGGSVLRTFLTGRIIDDSGINIISATIDTGAGTSGDIDISLTFPDLIESVTGLDTSASGIDINDSISGTIPLNGLDLKSGIKKVRFAGGSLGLNISNNISGLLFDWNSLTIAGLADDDNDGVIALAGQEVDLTGGGALDEVSYDLAIREDSSSLLNYAATDSIGVSGGFSDARIESVVVDMEDPGLTLDGFDSTVHMDPIEIDMDQELRDQLSKIEINPRIVVHLSGLEGLTMDLSSVNFTALDSSNNPVGVFDLGGGYTGLNPTIDLMAMDPDLLDFIKNPATRKIEVSGNYDISGENVVVGVDSKIGIESIDVQVPYEFALNDDIVRDTDPSEMDPVDSETKDILDDNGDGKLVITSLNNNFPLAIRIKIYAADISSTNLTTEQIKTELYSEDNVIKEFSIDMRTSYEKYFVELGSDDIKVFTNNNVYTGMRVILPENKAGEKYKFYTGDRISFDNVYVSLTGHVNN